jgi:hypothetical protein
LCFYGEPEQLTGVCRAGKHKCNCPDGEEDCTEGTWGPCTTAIYPTVETCNGRDDDCDGEADDGVVALGTCDVPEQQGACAAGVSECVNGVTVCTQTGEAKPEVCNGMDDDCDGMEDEELEAVPCYDELNFAGCAFSQAEGRYLCTGTCAPGMQRCEDGKPGTCENQVLPGEEICTTPLGLTADEDCDGKTDEAQECACNDGANYDCYEASVETANVAPCMMGMQLCTGGVLGDCNGQVLPSLETCANDGFDNDCDGNPDNVSNRGVGCTDSAKKGRCRNGTRECMDGDLLCVTLEEIPEVCNGADDDCDGAIDNGFDFQTDLNHCGACGIKCAAGMRCCEGACVNTQDDGNYCGSCGNRCSPGNECCNGVCRNVLSDVQHCDTCNNACPGLLLGLLPVCCNGRCATASCGG